MAEQAQMPESICEHLEHQMIGKKIAGFAVRDVLGAGNTAVTYEVADKYGIPWALKVVLRESYGDRAPFREVGRFAQTRDERYLVFPKEVGDWRLTLHAGPVDFIWVQEQARAWPDPSAIPQLAGRLLLGDRDSQIRRERQRGTRRA